MIRALLLIPLLATAPAVPIQDSAEETGPPAHVPDESREVTRELEEARALAMVGKAEASARAYQAVVDSKSWHLLAASSDPGAEVLEQARERAHRELAHVRGPVGDDLRGAYRERFEPAARELLDLAGSTGSLGPLREAFSRYPLTSSGARAGLLLAQALYRSGRADLCLGHLDRLQSLHPSSQHGAVDRVAVVRLRASAAASGGDRDLLQSMQAAADSYPDELKSHVTSLRVPDHLLPPAGPRGPLQMLWHWTPEPEDRDEEDGDPSSRPMHRREVPSAPDHSVAIRDGVAYWTDRFHVIGLSLETGGIVSRSVPVDGRPAGPARPGRDHRGEWFAAAADERGIVAALDVAGGSLRGSRAGSLVAFDRSLRARFRRGGPGDVEHPELSGRYVFHGRPLLMGDRVYIGATVAAGADDGAKSDVRTHVLAFRRKDLGLIWDRFVSYGSGIEFADVSPTGSLVALHGRLYFSTHTGLQTCLDARSGRILWARRYATPRRADTQRLTRITDPLTVPRLWPDCPPAFSGDWVAFTPRDSFVVDYLRQMPAADGSIRGDWRGRPRHDSEDLTVHWVLPGPIGAFFQAGRAGRLASPLVLRSMEASTGDSQVTWRGAVMERDVLGLPVRTAGALYLATSKAVYRVPYPGRDGEVERLATIPRTTSKGARLPRPGNLVVLPDRILSISNQGVICFGPPPPEKPE